jgi:hypothetical protein
MEVDEEKIETYNILGWGLLVDVVLKLGYIGAVLL